MRALLKWKQEKLNIIIRILFRGFFKLSIFLLITSFNNSNFDFGVVKYYNEDKGFGYIIDAGLKDEIYFYEESVIDEVEDGSKVLYKKRNTPKGFEAFDIKLR